MESTEVTINEETLFFDLNSIIGAIGGCMSLFVGFSLKDFILDALDILLAIRKRCCKKKAPKTPKISVFYVIFLLNQLDTFPLMQKKKKKKNRENVNAYVAYYFQK